MPYDTDRGIHRELPSELEPVLTRAKRLEWLPIAYLLSSVGLMYCTLGQSQAMKTAWADDTLGLVAPISFLITTRFMGRRASAEFPYGYHRAATIGYLTGSAALLVIGSLLLFDGGQALLSGERPSIGLVVIGGTPIWAGYLMLGALLWSTIPPHFLGKAKGPLAEKLHDKVLFADADTNTADWQMGTATMLGIVAIGFGWWWADGLMSVVLSTSIIFDGYQNLKQAVADLLGQTPKTVDREHDDPLVGQVRDVLLGLDWVQAGRLREEDHLLYGEGFLVARDKTEVLRKLQQATDAVRGLDWRIQDVVLRVVDELPD